MRVNELITRFLDTRPNASSEQRCILRQHIEPRWGRTKVRDIRAADIEAWWPSLKRTNGKAGLAEGTKRQVIAHFSVLLEYGCELCGGSNPVKRMKRRPSQPDERMRILSHDEEALLFAYSAQWPWLQDLITVALYQGLRLGEVLGLQWGSIDFAANKLRVCHSLDNTTTLGGTKHAKLTGKRDPRDKKPIDLMPAARDVLLKLRMDASEGYVFHNGHGLPPRASARTEGV